MNNKLTAKQRKHIGKVRELPCSVCDAPGPSEAHHLVQSQQFTVISLCPECHRDAEMGWHGRKTAWRIRKMDELGALNKTIERLSV